MGSIVSSGPVTAVPVESPQNVTAPVNGTSPAPQSSSLAPSSTGAVFNSTSLALSVTSGASTPPADPSSVTKAAAGPAPPTDPAEPVSSESKADSAPTSPSSVAKTPAAPASSIPVTTSAAFVSKTPPSVPVDKPIPKPPASESSVQSASPVDKSSSVEPTSTPVSQAPTSVAQKPTSVGQKPGVPSDPAQPTSPELGQSSPTNTMTTNDGGRPQDTSPTSSAGDKGHDNDGDGGKPAPSSASPSASSPAPTHSTENASADPGNGPSSASDAHVTSSPAAPQSQPSSAAPVSSKSAQGASPASAGAGSSAGAGAPASQSSPADAAPTNANANAKAKGSSSVIVETNTAPDITSTSTITDQPESTFARPVSIPVTTGGSTVLTAPPFITSLATSTEPNGVVTTITHIIANPTNGLSQDLQRHSFFDNHGAVIGVFLAVGIVTSLAAGALLWLCCRRRKEKRAHRLESQSPTLPPHDPFLDPVEEPRMSMIADRRSAIDWDRIHLGRGQPGSGSDNDVDLLDLPAPIHTPEHAHAGLPSVRPGFDVAGSARVYPHINDSYDGPFSDYHQVHARHLASREDVRVQAHSRARSTPSLYPPSVLDDTADSLYEREMRAMPPPSPRNTVESGHFRALSADAAMMTGVGTGVGIGIGKAITTDYVPMQRGNVTTPMDYEPASLTPPMSVSSHMTSQLESPTTPTSPTMGHNTPPDEALQRKLPALKEVAAGAFLKRTYSKAGIRRGQRD